MMPGMARKANTNGKVSSRVSAAERFCAASEPARSPLASRADISGSSTVPNAMPSTPSGNWLMRSA